MNSNKINIRVGVVTSVVSPLKSYYTIRFPYFMLAITRKANGMYTQRKLFYLCYTPFIIGIGHSVGHTQMLYTFFSNLCWLLGDKSVLSVPTEKKL